MADLIQSVVSSHINYTYVHLISGMDLPLENQDYIHSFFREHNGEEFIEVAPREWSDYYSRRLRYYYPFQDLAGAIESHTVKQSLYSLQTVIVKTQQLFRVNRIKGFKHNLIGGSNWFSITGNCACYVAEQAANYMHLFKQTYCADEFFLQTILSNSEFYGKRYKSDDVRGNMRSIDWINEAHPKVYEVDDVIKLLDSKYLFARKFDEKVDSRAIDLVVHNIR